MTTNTPPVIQDLGDETPSETTLREWVQEQEARNLDRLEGGAQTLLQLVTGLYGVLFGVLALDNTPTYLADVRIRWLAVASMGFLFCALIGALVVVYPARYTYQQNNLTDMERVFRQISERKMQGLGIATLCFGVGLGALVAVIAIIVVGG